MGSGEEGLEGGEDGGAEGGAVGGVFDYRAGWVSVKRSEGIEVGGVREERSLSYRSIAVIRGETRPEAQAAAVMSEVTRHGKFFVFHS